jgi:hypothetical protein
MKTFHLSTLERLGKIAEAKKTIDKLETGAEGL